MERVKPILEYPVPKTETVEAIPGNGGVVFTVHREGE